MSNDRLSLILLPTLKCNAACDYCFERKASRSMSLEEFRVVLHSVLDYMDESEADETDIYWQGGEVFTLEPEWYLKAHDLMQEECESRGKRIVNQLQSNLIGYGERWRRVVHEMFQGELGSSLDFPNKYRRLPGQGPETYETLWRSKFEEARAHGIEIGLISLLNKGAFDVGAKEFYSYYVNEIGSTSFQINTPFPGGDTNAAKRDFPLDMDKLAHFFVALIDTWMEDGFSQGVRVGPFDAILQYFLDGTTEDLPCPWAADCTRLFFCIDPVGNVSQCDCWVSSYPEYRFGNIFDGKRLSEILAGKPRMEIRRRPVELMRNSDCIDCSYLSLCHGGCAIRAYSTHGGLFEKDPYCKAYKAVFRHLEEIAVRLSREAAIGDETEDPRVGIVRDLTSPYPDPGEYPYADENDPDSEGGNTAVVYCSYECTNNCIFCAPADIKGKNPDDISQQVHDFIDRCAAEGVGHLDFSGAGEPTLNPEIVEYVSHARQLGIQHLSMTTNGARITRELVRSLVQAGLNDFTVSLHGIGEVHDAMAGRKGSYQEAMRALEIINGSEADELAVNTCVTGLNVDQLEEILVTARQFARLTSHFLSWAEWNGNVLLHRDKMCTLSRLKARLACIDQSDYPHLVLDNVPYCIAPHLNHQSNANGAILLKDTDRAHVVERSLNLGNNIIPQRCFSLDCPHIGLCVGLDRHYHEEHGDGELGVSEVEPAGEPMTECAG